MERLGGRDGAGLGWRRARGWRAVIGQEVEARGLAHAFALVINDDTGGRTAPLEADLDRTIGQVARRLEARRLELLPIFF